MKPSGSVQGQQGSSLDAVNPSRQGVQVCAPCWPRVSILRTKQSPYEACAGHSRVERPGPSQAAGGGSISSPSLRTRRFGQAQRRAVLDAAGLAGLNVLSLINTHAAAALQFGIERSFVNKTEHVIFYDMGHSSTEVPPGPLRRTCACHVPRHGPLLHGGGFGPSMSRLGCVPRGAGMEARDLIFSSMPAAAACCRRRGEWCSSQHLRRSCVRQGAPMPPEASNPRIRIQKPDRPITPVRNTPPQPSLRRLSGCS